MLAILQYRLPVAHQAVLPLEVSTKVGFAYPVSVAYHLMTHRHPLLPALTPCI
jgi:hypothetical protein